MKILVIKLRAIGDVVMSTAVIPNLRHAFPSAEIDFLVDHQALDAVKGHPHLNRVLALPRIRRRGSRKSRSFREMISLVYQLRKRHYDMVFDLYGNPRSALLAWMTHAPIRVGFDFRGRRWLYTRRIPPRGDFVHEVEFNLDALSGMGIPIVERNPMFPLSDGDLTFIDNWIQKSNLRGAKRIGFHVWGGWPAKRWGLDRFAHLADRLIESWNVDIVLLWGPGEKQAADSVMEQMSHPARLAPETTLKQLGALIQRCDLVIANDSGPMHIAAALGTPVVGIYGPTKARLQGPYGSGHRAVYKKDLECLGCNKQSCPAMTCMETLTLDDVWKVIVDCVSEAGWSVTVPSGSHFPSPESRNGSISTEHLKSFSHSGD